MLDGVWDVHHIEVERCASSASEAAALCEGVVTTRVCSVECHAEGVEETLLHLLLRDAEAIAVDEA